MRPHAATAIAVLALAGCGGSEEPDCDRPPDFDAWRQATSEPRAIDDAYEDERRAVGRHLVTCASLTGSTRRRTRALLGPPQETYADPGTGGVWEWYLGPDWLGIDDETLVVVFTRSGRVARVRVAQG